MLGVGKRVTQMDIKSRKYMKLHFFAILFLTFLDASNPKVMLLKTYKEQNITNWIMSEKLDGIRGYWDGKHLLTRHGNTIYAPKWFIKNYPPFAIDGELWSKRKDFEFISSTVRDKKPNDKDWRKIKHYIFDVPNAKGNLFKRLKKVKPYESDIIKIIPQYIVKSKKELKNFLKKIEQKGGEGVVVRDPNAPYFHKRSSKILKVKSFKDDECKVIGYTKGKGKNRGKVGSLICKFKNITIKIGSGLTEKLREVPPKIGTIITFKYKELSKYGKPRFPVFLRVRYTKEQKYTPLLRI